MNELDPAVLLEERIAKMGGQLAVAVEAGVSPSEISLIVTGRRPCTAKVLKYLGLKKEVVYSKIEK